MTLYCVTAGEQRPHRHCLANCLRQVRRRRQSRWLRYLPDIAWRLRSVFLFAYHKGQHSAAADPRDAVPHTHRIYTDVDGQCDKLVTDDRHQFSLSHWLSTQVDSTWDDRRDNSTCSRSRYVVGAQKKFNGSRDLTTPLSRMIYVYRLWASTTYVPNLKSVFPLTTKIWKLIQSVENGVVLGS